MTPEELEVQKCLDKVFAYCKQHGDSCQGCIFYKLVRIGRIGITSCRVMYAPEIFGKSGKDEE